MKKRLILLLIFAMLLGACNAPTTAGEPPTPAVDDVATVVALTLQALSTPTPAVTATPAATDTPAPSPSPAPAGSEVSGRVCYPKNQSMDMVVYFQNIADSQTVEQPVAAGSATYTLLLKPGVYAVYMWAKDFTFGGLACTPEAGCQGNSVRQITVQAGSPLTGVDLCDWNNGPFDVPYPPGKSAQSVVGSISGVVLNYPGGITPAFTVIAFNQNTGYWYSWQPAVGDGSFTLANLPPGIYQVVAYDQNNLAGGAPGLVTLGAGQNVYVQVTDWSGAYPPKP